MMQKQDLKQKQDGATFQLETELKPGSNAAEIFRHHHDDKGDDDANDCEDDGEDFDESVTSR